MILGKYLDHFGSGVNNIRPSVDDASSSWSQPGAPIDLSKLSNPHLDVSMAGQATLKTAIKAMQEWLVEIKLMVAKNNAKVSHLKERLTKVETFARALKDDLDKNEIAKDSGEVEAGNATSVESGLALSSEANETSSEVSSSPPDASSKTPGSPSPGASVSPSSKEVDKPEVPPPKSAKVDVAKAKSTAPPAKAEMLTESNDYSQYGEEPTDVPAKAVDENINVKPARAEVEQDYA